ncbi:hypothetical protein DFP72DRAFT_891953 [Ephemerocybe angulata]|uniref:BZIP domain-containing protein n=1 Tax=Ephemerocybe angulata TaxID=980116 RepID=A0A8H6I4H0_9AGAR|nr:hypothetical protein DFP72DRAFT_891953 [Tulosesus angulatus]
MSSSSKRGRKRNDNLPPNRARDVQRAFRARRAAHLQALEQRVAELEEENNYLRQELNLPPSSRPPLGRGPTGKDRPKLESGSNGSPFGSSRDSSSLAGSPPSRQSSVSPGDAIPVSMSPSCPMTLIGDNGTWDDSIALQDHSHPTNPSPTQIHDGQYQMAPIPTSIPLKSMVYPSYPNTVPSSSRHSSDPYVNHNAQGYSHAPERPSSTHYPHHSYLMREDMREDVSRSHFLQYPSPPSNGFHHSQAPPHSAQVPARHLHHPQPSSTHAHSIHQNQDHAREIESPAPFNTRRQVTNTSGYAPGQGYPSLANPSNLTLQSRSQLTDYIQSRASDAPQSLGSTARSPYNSDGRLRSLT